MKRVLLWAIVVVALIAAVGLIAWVVVPPALVDLDFGHEAIDDSVRAQALAANRQSVLLAVGGLIALVGVVVTVTRLFLEREADRRAEASHDLERDENRTSRYAKAIEELGSERVEIQLGGIYALERLARDSELDLPVIGEVLAAFIRSRGAADEPRSEPERAACIVVARGGFESLDLTGARLHDLNLDDALLPRVILDKADLTRTTLRRANLEHAKLNDINSEAVILDDANLESAVLQHLTLLRSHFRRTNLQKATMGEVKLEGSSLDSTNLEGAVLKSVEIIEGSMSSVNLRWARISQCKVLGALVSNSTFGEAKIVDTDFSRSLMIKVDMRGVAFGKRTAAPASKGDLKDRFLRLALAGQGAADSSSLPPILSSNSIALEGAIAHEEADFPLNYRDYLDELQVVAYKDGFRIVRPK